MWKIRINVPLQTLSRDLNGLLQMDAVLTRDTNYPEQAHVMEAEDEEEVRIKEEENSVPWSQRVQINPQYHNGQDYSTQ